MFEQIRQYCESYGYIVLGAGVMLENAGIPVPGETAVVAAGFMASVAGGQVFDIRLVIVVTIIAAVIGDNIGFWLGRELARPRLQRGKGFLFLNRRTLAVAEGYFARFGAWTIFFARFITGIRVIGALAAGTAGMQWRRFLVANAAGAAVWATTFALLGYYFGQNWKWLERWIGRTGLGLLALAMVGGYLFWRYRDRWLPAAPQNGAAAGARSTDADSRTVE
jgi:membrane protein DedA with SNARE-associated domain